MAWVCRWLFAVQPLPYDHVVSVALGPVAEAVDAYGVSEKDRG